jgi:hypothetical protein
MNPAQPEYGEIPTRQNPKLNLFSGADSGVPPPPRGENPAVPTRRTVWTPAGAHAIRNRFPNLLNPVTSEGFSSPHFQCNILYKLAVSDMTAFLINSIWPQQ